MIDEIKNTFRVEDFNEKILPTYVVLEWVM